MKLQHLTVIFALIFLPIFLITSYYIQNQVDTINLQLSYDSKLLDATYDAMSAFEINTADEDLSSVSDSLRSIIEASNSIFLNTLATNLGYSNASTAIIQSYVPAVLYTLYDGYYIYSPTNVPTVLTDKYGQTISVGDYGVSYIDGSGTSGRGRYSYTGATGYDESKVATGGDQVDYDDLERDGIEEEYGQLLYKNKDGSYSTVLQSKGNDYDTYYKQDYILKSYVSYSANYYLASADNGGNGDINITINYTLDNFISISGTINGVYYSKSGYLINNNLVSKVYLDGTEVPNWYDYSDETWEEYIYDPENHEVRVELSDGTEISNKETYDTANDGSVVSYWDDAQSAVEYYIDSWMFSKWVYENFSNIREKDVTTSWSTYNDSSVDLSAEQTEQLATLIYDFTNDTDKIFNAGEDPEGESTFEEHRRNIIKNSINYNLALALLTYSDMRTLEEYDLPIFKDTEWDTILNNVSVVSFLEGLNCGLKYYNNYAIATSTNNEITVTTSEIYYVAVEESTTYKYADGSAPYYGRNYFSNIEDSVYDEAIETAHRIDCSELDSTYTKDDGTEEDIEYYISFTSKEIKYDKLYDSTLRQICL